MTPQYNPDSGGESSGERRTQVSVALIGAVGAVITAIVTGLFGLILLLHNGSSSGSNSGSGPSTPTLNPAADYVGSWHNIDPNTGSWVHIDITLEGNTITAHFVGACVPTPCDAGSASSPFVGTPVHLTLESGFAVKSFTLSLVGATLQVTTFTHFTDNSGRSDYTSQDSFQR